MIGKDRPFVKTIGSPSGKMPCGHVIGSRAGKTSNSTQGDNQSDDQHCTLSGFLNFHVSYVFSVFSSRLPRRYTRLQNLIPNYIRIYPEQLANPHETANISVIRPEPDPNPTLESALVGVIFLSLDPNFVYQGCKNLRFVLIIIYRLQQNRSPDTTLLMPILIIRGEFSLPCDLGGSR
jgi:hypothetical protein